MLKNFFLTTLRNISRNRIYAFINVFGLSIGLASSILILLFVTSELSYDNNQPKADHIYRLYLDGVLEGRELKGGHTSIASGPVFQQEIPEITEFARFKTTGQTILIYKEEKYIEDNFVYADSAVFRIFDFKMLEGNPETALRDPNTIVLTQSLAKKIFGSEEALNKVIAVNNDTIIYTVTGIVEDLPPNTHFKFSALASYHSLEESNRTFWLSNNVFTYLLFDEKAIPDEVQKKINEVSLKYIGPQLLQILGISIDQFEGSGNKYSLKIQKLRDIHLNNEIEGSFTPAHDSKYLTIFGFIAFLIMLVASINFMNLSTARSANRAKEVGIRKVLGSRKVLLIRQFLWESVVLTLISLLFGLLLVELLLPKFNELIELNLTINYFSHWYIIPGLLGITMFVGLLSGSYPSFVLSSFKPIEVLKGDFNKGKKGGLFRNILVILQFSISIIIIAGTLMVYKQLNFMLNKDLGFKKDQIVIINRIWPLNDQIETFMQEAEKLSGIANASNSTQYPGEVNNDNGFAIKGRDKAKTYLLVTNWTDYDYIETYQVPMVQGRFFSQDFGSDSSACIINETAARDFEIEKPLETTFLQPGNEEGFRELKVIGVMKDYHLTSLREQIRPAIFILKPKDWWGGYGNLRLTGEPSSYKNTIEQVEKLWNKFAPGEPFLYFYLDDHFRQLYNEEIRTGRISMIFSILAILIASLGLFGLTLFTTEKRIKEIGIRKVMGASVKNVVFLILKDISILLLMSTALAWTASYFIMENWLQAFPYKVNIGVSIFLLSAGMACLISFITVGIQAYRAAIKNPADILHYE
jgi:putative ABC transport system permease protein